MLNIIHQMQLICLTFKNLFMIDFIYSSKNKVALFEENQETNYDNTQRK